MKANVGGIDKILRIVVGLALIAWAILGGPVWGLDRAWCPWPPVSWAGARPTPCWASRPAR